jgi:hypothetical protein
VARGRLGHRAKQLFLAVTFVAFSTFGIAMLAFGRGADRLWGLISVLFFGVGGVMYFLLPRFTRRGREGVRLGTIRFRGASRPAVVFPQSRGKRRVALVGTTAFTAAGILMAVSANALADPDESANELLVVGLLCAVVFGVMTIVGLVTEFLSAAYVALLPEGIVGGGPLGGSYLPWDAVAEVDIIEIHGNPMVAVVASDPAAIETSSLGLLLSRAGRATTGADLTFAGLVAPLETLRDAIDHYLDHPNERAGIGTENPARYTGSAVPR